MIASGSEAHVRLAAAAEKAGIDPDELLAVLQEPKPSEPEPEPPEPTGPDHLLSDAAIRAAVSDTFTYAELAAAEGATSETAEAQGSAIDAVLACTTPVVLGGERRLRLFPEVRRDIIALCRDTEAFKRILKQARDDDEGSKNASPAQRQSIWLRRFLGGWSGRLDDLALPELSSAAAALEALDGVPVGTTLPSASEARRLLDLAHLVEPLKLLVGASDFRAKGDGRDRFVGRADELTKLRSYVDELDSETVFEGFQRAVAGAARIAGQALYGRSPGPFVLEARGGLGKSTLIAKFVLDHAMAQGDHPHFTFAYLDFDRAGLQGDVAQLLSEVARQVALQLPALAPSLAGLRAASPHASDALPLFDQLARFRDLIRAATNGGTFLLVLDTMEVVQYNPQWLPTVIEFVRGLHGGEFPELRVVAAGRADIAELREETEFWSQGTLRTLGPLAVREARDMVSRLGRDLMPDDWDDVWAARIAGTSAQPANRREPLSLRVATELVRSIDGHSAREAFTEEIAEAGDAHDSFVGKLYERRILDHVRDPEVKKLAWPGLVLRIITRKIIEAVLAEPCKIDPAAIDRVFDALGREVWIVRREGEVLRHRPDLRARTLPLMRRRDRTRFDRINRAAIDYFAQYPTAEGRAEWLYHRLLAGEPPETVDRDWDDKLAPLLAGASEDFATDLPAAAAYLQARTSRRLLPAARLAELPVGLAFEHVAQAARRLTKLDDMRTSPTVLDLAIRANPNPEPSLPPEAEAAKLAMLIKSGRWRAPAIELSDGNRDGSSYYDFGWSYYAARAGVGSYGAPSRILLVQAKLVDEFRMKPSSARVRARIQDLARFRIEQRKDWTELDRAVAHALTEPSAGPSSPLDIGALRLCAVVGRESAAPAVREWLRTSARREVNSLSQAVAEAELLALARCANLGAFFQILGPPLHAVDINPEMLREWAAKDEPAAEMKRSYRPRIEHPELVRAVHHLIKVLNESPHPVDQAALRRFFAVRSEDWIVPLGYALLRRRAGEEPPGAVLDLLGSEGRGGWIARLSGRRAPRLSDPLVLLRRADEGGQVGQVLEIYLEAATADDPDVDEDFGYLVHQHRRWREFLSACTLDKSSGA